MKNTKHGNQFANELRKEGYIHVIVLGSFFVVGMVIGFILALALINETM
jgi:hypothetical protein